MNLLTSHSLSMAKASMMTALGLYTFHPRWCRRTGYHGPPLPRREHGRDHRIDILTRGREQGNCFHPILIRVPEEMVGPLGPPMFQFLNVLPPHSPGVTAALEVEGGVVHM